MATGNQNWPNLRRCRDYPILQKVITKKELDLYENQLTEYLDMAEATDICLCHVPRIICWYEGIIPTVDFIGEYKDCL